jgi:N-glycosidase YbiA
MDEYLQKLDIFYDQKMKYLSNKEKYIRCNECDDKKEFNEEKDKLILSCGSEKGECGPQIIIKLPKYIHYETKLDELRASIENEYNWETLQNYLDVTDKVEGSNQKNKTITEEIIRIESMFFKKNMEMKQKQLQSFYDQRIRKTKKCKELGKELKKEGLTEEQKKVLRQEYIRNVQEMNTEYSDIKELVKDINPFLTEEEPEVIIKHENYEYTKEKKKKSIREVGDGTLIDEMLKVFVVNDGILTKENYVKLKVKGRHKRGWGKSLFGWLMLSRLGNDKPWKYKEQKKYGDIIENPKSNDPPMIELTDAWKKYLIIEFEVGMRVSWVYKGTTKYGSIKEIKGKGALVEDEKGKEKIRMLNKLMIEALVEEDDDDDIEIDSDEDEEEEEAITYFSRSKDNKWLSTFNRGEPFNYDGLLYPTVEHAFHAQKVDDEKKEEYQELFTNDEIDPSEAKKMGGKKNFELNSFSLRKDWDNVKLEKMKEITMEYYAANPKLAEKLRKTGSKKLLHTGFRIDDYWGKKNGEGENNHGMILMKIRETI